MSSFSAADALLLHQRPCKITRRSWPSIYDDDPTAVSLSGDHTSYNLRWSCYHSANGTLQKTILAGGSSGCGGDCLAVDRSTLMPSSCSASSSLCSCASVCIYCGGLSSAQLQPRLWSQLPQEIIERILAFLPVWSIFRFRTVCKAWRSLVYSRAFLRLQTELLCARSSTKLVPAWHDPVRYKSRHHCQEARIISGDEETDVGGGKVYFLALNRSRYQQLSAYEVRSKKWHTFPVDFLPAVAYPVAAAKGLICFLASNFETGCASLLVCNPMTRCWKELPSMRWPQRRVPFFISMVVDRESLTYKVLVAGGLNNRRSGYDDGDDIHRSTNGSNSTTEIYDSATGGWSMCESDIPQNEIIQNGGVVEHCGYYLCLRGRGRGRGRGFGHQYNIMNNNIINDNILNNNNNNNGSAIGSSSSSSHGLLAFNLHKQMWVKMPTGRIPGYSKFRHLVECEGSILIVGKALRRYVLGLYIWCLDPHTLRWKEVGKMPRAICEQFFSSPSECFYCVAQGHHIFFCRYFYTQGLIYNILENSWQQVAGCPLLTHPFLLPFDPGLDPVD